MDGLQRIVCGQCRPLGCCPNIIILSLTLLESFRGSVIRVVSYKQVSTENLLNCFGYFHIVFMEIFLLLFAWLIEYINIDFQLSVQFKILIHLKISLSLPFARMNNRTLLGIIFRFIIPLEPFILLLHFFHRRRWGLP